MSDQVVTELVIDADTSGADAYSSAMDSVADSAGKGLEANRNLALSIAGVSVGITGAVLAIKAGVDYFVDFNKQLAGLDALAQSAGLSLTDVQSIQFGGQLAGLSPDQINAGLEKSAQLLADARINANSLTKELDANGISVKNANGQLISENQLLGIAADLVSRARSTQDGIAIAQMLGFTKEWVPFLQQGAAAMDDLAANAQAAGVIIDDSTIARAKQFDDEWRASSVTFSVYMRAMFAGLLPYADDLLKKAKEWVDTLDPAKIEAAAKAQSDAGAKAAGLDPEGGIKVDFSGLYDAIDGLKNSEIFTTGFWAGLAKAFSDNVKVLSPTDMAFEVGNQKSYADTSPAGLGSAVQWQAQANGVKALDDSLVKLDGTFKKVSGDYSEVAARGNDANDALDRAINMLERHTAKTNADDQAIGTSIGKQEELRAIAALTTAAHEAGIPVTDALAAKFQLLGTQAGTAAQALAYDQAVAKAQFDLQTAGLSGVELQIAQIQYRLHGNDWQAWMNDGISSATRLAADIKGAMDTARQSATTFATDLIQGMISGKSGAEALDAALKSVGQALVSSGVKNFIQGAASGDPVQAAIGGVEAIGGAIAEWLGGQSDAEKALKDAQLAWQKMAIQVANFNEAAKGINLGPLTQELQSLISTLEQLQVAALKANDTASVAQLDQTFALAVNRIVTEFKDGTPALNDYQKAQKALTDEAQGLVDTLISLKDYSTAVDVENSLQVQLKALAEQFVKSFSEGLQARINTAQGNDYLNQVAAAITQHQQDTLEAAQLGVSQGLVDQTFTAEIQKIVDDAGLVGDAFNGFIAQFPQFAGVVHESSSALQAANDKFAQLTKTINDYLNGLALGSNSTLSPQQQLALAQSNFSQQFSLARAGDQTALGSITQYADAYLNAGKSFYASSGGYTDIYNAVTSALSSLIGSGGAGLGSPSSQIVTSPLFPSSTGTGAIITPQVSVASNDNTAQYFQSQTTALSQVYTQVGQAIVAAIANASSDNKEGQNRIVAAIAANNRRPVRPLDKVAS